MTRLLPILLALPVFAADIPLILSCQDTNGFAVRGWTYGHTNFVLLAAPTTNGPWRVLQEYHCFQPRGQWFGYRWWFGQPPVVVNDTVVPGTNIVTEQYFKAYTTNLPWNPGTNFGYRILWGVCEINEQPHGAAGGKSLKEFTPPPPPGPL